MDDFELPDDLKDDVEVIYSDGEGDYGEEVVEELLDAITLEENEIEAEVIDISKLTFNKHSKSVFCSDLSKDSKLAVTGGEDDTAFVWDTETTEIVFECTGHKDSVIQVGFNFDSQYVATADMGGLVQVWNVAEKKLIWCFEGDDLEWMIWHPLANVLFCGCQTGDVYIWQIPQGNFKTLSGNSSCTTCAKILPNGKQIVVGYQDGLLKLWDIKSTAGVWQTKVNETINNLDVNADGSLVIVAPSADIIKLSDGKVTSTVMADGEKELEAALFNSELGIVATGSLSGNLCVWELGRQSLRHQARIECAVTILKWGQNGKILIGATDGAIYVCDVKSGTLLDTLTGHQSDILSISVFSDGSKVLTTSDDGTSKIFDIKS